MTPATGTAAPSVEERARVGMMVSRYRRRAAVERLALYRRHLQVTVAHATPLLRMLVADLGVDVRGALQRLRPPHGWPDVSRTGSWLTFAQVMSGRRRSVRPDRVRMDPSRTVVIRDHRDPAGTLILNIGRDAVEVTVRIGEVTLRTCGGFIDVVLGFELPATIELAIVGRPARCLIDHLWFADERWVVDSVRRGDKGMHPRTTVTVATGQEPFALPWRRLLGTGG